MPKPKKDPVLTKTEGTRRPQIKEVVNNVKIRNLSLQGLELCFGANGKFDTTWICPREEREIPRKYLSDQILNLQQQRMIRIS
tara:strand:- start:167 stop:415 length:249 start_codon:yes stop_codon:yes gene_type:complete